MEFRSDLVRNILERDQRFIIEAQSKAVRYFTSPRTGNLLDQVAGQTTSVKVSGASAGFSLSFPIYLRFQDIKNKNKAGSTGLSLYNRTIWGRLYRETRPALRLIYLNIIRSSITEKLNDIAHGTQSR